MFPCNAGESAHILKGVFYSSPAKGRDGRAVFTGKISGKFYLILLTDSIFCLIPAL